jgi:hypothetical protein
MINNIQQVYFIHKIIVVLSLILFIYILSGIPNSHDDRKLYIPLIIYSFVALYRSICMTNETEKLCLVKSKFCQPTINRTLATIAETSIGFFTIMIISKIFGVNIPIFLGGIIIIAQILCWIGVVTSNPKYNAVEESLWTIFFGIILVYIIFSKRNQSVHKCVVIIGIICYLLFMIIIDIPHYLKNKPKNNGSFTNCQYSNNVDDWRYVIVWQGLYFTMGVLFFLYLWKNR